MIYDWIQKKINVLKESVWNMYDLIENKISREFNTSHKKA